ncbi:MAG: hypothetical protein WCT07_04670 [Candidatus Paceibacterota bacterium]
MKNKIVLVFLFSLLIPIHFTFADLKAAGIYGTGIGTQSNPIHVQVDQNPTQAWSDAWTKLRSIQYVSACASIYKTINSQSALNVDLSNPASATREANYLNYLYSSYQSCVSRAAQMQSQTCPNGTGLRNGACVSQDRVCEIDLGVGFKWDGTYGSNGGANCSCKDGYSLQNGKCVVVQPVQTNNSILPLGCTSTQGFNAIDGTPCGNTKPTETSYQAPSGGGSGTAPIPKTGVKVKTPVTKKMVEVKDSTPVIANQDIKVTANTEEKPKSFWIRLKGWLGF